MMQASGVGPTPMSKNKYVVGTGFVALPSDMDRDQYITLCYQRSAVCIRTEEGSFFSKVPISYEDLNYIEFPKKTNENGSQVVYVTDELRQIPIVVTILNKLEKLVDLEEDQFKMRRIYNDNHVEIAGSPRREYLSITVDSANTPQLFLNIFNINGNGKLNVMVQGNTEVYTQGEVTFTQNKGFSTQTVDPNNNSNLASFDQTTTANKFQNKKFVINAGKEPMVLGNQLVTFLNLFIDQVSNITTTTAIGQQPILNKLQVLNLKNSVNQILSNIGSLE